MLGNLKIPFVLIVVFVIAGIVLLNFSEEDQLTQILWLKGKACDQPIQVDRPTEGALIVQCANDKAYWLSALLGCESDCNFLRDVFTACSWRVSELDPKTLKSKSPGSKP